MATSPISKVLQHFRTAMLAKDRTGLTDGQLLACFVERRDEAAFAALVRRHGPMVWGVCRRILNHEDAEDAFQAAFLVLFRKAASIRPREMMANWLYGVAHQAALQARRTALRRQARERQVTQMPEPSVAARDAWRELQPLLDQELSRLPNKYRLAIVLCDLECKSRKEAARQLRCPEGTVASRLATARTMLAKRLARHGLAVSGASLAALLAQSGASATVPISAVASTIQAATFLAAGKSVPAGVLSANVVSVVEGVLKSMLLTKVKIMTAVMLGLVLTAGSGLRLSPWGKAFGQSSKADNPHSSVLRHLFEYHLAQLAPAANQEPTNQKAESEARIRANAILDRAIKAMGGQAKLEKTKAIAWKAKGKSFKDGNEYPFTNETTVQGLDQIRMEHEDEVDGTIYPGATILNGNKGWRKDGDALKELDGDRLANQKRNLYLLVVPITLVPLKDKAFQIEPAGEVKVDGQPAIGLKVTGPDGKDFNLFFDKESGRPVKLEVRMTAPAEFTQETFFRGYKDFNGIQKATKIERKRDGQKILEQEITEFKVLDKVAPETFAEPK